MINALATLPTSPPEQLGGTTPAILTGQSMVIAFMRTDTLTTDVSLIAWAPELKQWMVYPVDPVTLTGAGGTGVQRYVFPHTSSGLYFTFLKSVAGTAVFVDVVLGNAS